MLPVSDFKLKRKSNNYNHIGKIRIKLVVVFAVVVATLFGAQLVFASNLAIDGQKISEVDNQISQLEAQNTMLKVEIANESSLVSLTKKAEDAGYKTPNNVIILQK